MPTDFLPLSIRWWHWLNSKRKNMKRLWPFLIILLTLVLGCRGGQSIVCEGGADLQPCGACHTETCWQQDGRHHGQMAVLSDATHLYRLCTSRSQRVQPSHGVNGHRLSGKSPAGGRFTFVSSQIYRFLTGDCRLKTAVMRFFVSRDYYVIALRHIIR